MWFNDASKELAGDLAQRLSQLIDDQPLGAAIHAREGFIEEQQVRLLGDRPGQVVVVTSDLHVLGKHRGALP